jgi:hypothetical protein
LRVCALKVAIRVSKLFEVVLNPSLRADPSKSVYPKLVESSHRFLLVKLIDLSYDAIDNLSSPVQQRAESNTARSFAACHSICCGLLLLLQGSSIDGSSLKVLSEYLKQRALSRVEEMLHRLRKLFLNYAQTLRNNDLVSSSSSRIQYSGAVQSLFDTAVDLYSHLLDYLANMTSMRQQLLHAKISADLFSSYHLLTIPMLTCMTSVDMKLTIASSSSTHALMTIVGDDDSMLLERLHELSIGVSHSVAFAVGIETGHWLLGNLSSCASDIFAVDGAQPGSRRVSFLNACRNLLHAYPLPNLLCGRQTTIWTKIGASLTAASVPIPLQRQILEDGLLMPSFLRMLIETYLQRIPSSALRVLEADATEVSEALAAHRNALDMAQQSLQNLQQGSFTSKWAKRLLQNMGISSPSLPNIFARETKPVAAAVTATDEMSEESSAALQHQQLDEDGLVALLKLWTTLLPLAALSPPDSIPWRAISSIAFSKQVSARLLGAAYHLLSKHDAKASLDNHVQSIKIADELISFGQSTSSRVRKPDGVLAALICLAATLKVALITTDDDELYRDHGASRLPVLELSKLLVFVRLGKLILSKLIRYQQQAGGSSIEDDKSKAKTTSSSPSIMGFISSMFHSSASAAAADTLPDPTPTSAASSSLITQQPALASVQVFSIVKCFASCLKDLHARWSRRPFSRDHHLFELIGADALSAAQLRDSFHPLTASILREMPFTIPFTSRLQLVRQYLDSERARIQGPAQGTGAQDLLAQAMMQQTRSKGTIVRIHRHQILSDGMRAFAKLRDGQGEGSIRDRIVVRYIDDRGEEEKGIDLGGLFKDFLTDLTRQVFDPSYGIFAATAEGLLYPNPNSLTLFAEETSEIYRFVGQVLGKALFEDITIQVSELSSC